MDFGKLMSAAQQKHQEDLDEQSRGEATTAHLLSELDNYLTVAGQQILQWAVSHNLPTTPVGRYTYRSGKSALYQDISGEWLIDESGENEGLFLTTQGSWMLRRQELLHTATAGDRIHNAMRRPNKRLRSPGTSSYVWNRGDRGDLHLEPPFTSSRFNPVATGGIMYRRYRFTLDAGLTIDRYPSPGIPFMDRIAENLSRRLS